MNKREQLARVPLFSKLEPKNLDRLAELSMPKSFAKDALLIKEGTVGLGLFVIVSGRVEAYKGEGEKRCTLGVMEDGAVVGEMALVDEHYRSANVRALEPTECLLVSRDSFNTLVRQEPGIALAVMSVVGERIRRLHGKVQDLEKKVGPSGSDTKEAVQDWATSDQPGRQEAFEAGVGKLREGQREVLRAGADFIDGWMGIMGVVMGGLVRTMDVVNETAWGGLTDSVSTSTRHLARTFSRSVDEGMRAFDEARAERGHSPEWHSSEEFHTGSK